MIDRAALRVLAEALPAGAAMPVPREWVLELLEEAQPGRETNRDLTVQDLCLRFGRKPSAVRAWLERGLFPGAYKLRRRDWRVPPAAVDAFAKAQQADGVRPGRARAVRARAPDLGAWRRLA